MAEIKNNFLSSKMNQDIDDRLMPNNEYRYALNLEINRSDNSDVGTLQNILGNKIAVNFRTITNTPDLQAIGFLTDDSNDNIYVFLTNYSGETYSPTARNYIYVYNTKEDQTNTNGLPNSAKQLVSGAWLNFSTKYPIYGINIVEDLLFWTDNRNQPRKINVQKALNALANSQVYYTIEEQISVAKLSPLYAPILFKESSLAEGEYETTMYDVVSETLPNGTPNPYLKDNWAGDPAYLEGRFVRFSYRYKFDDSEYSIMAPFTQIAYIPKQDGFFMYKDSNPVSANPEIDDETSAYRSTIVSFMQNKVNNILLRIPLPCPANQVNSLYKINEIEILYKEADGLAVSAVDSIPTIPDSSKGSGYIWNTTNDVYTYDYQSKKPFKTLPNRDLIRVNDIVPIKALSQEIVGNRVVYGNYQDKYTYPKYLNYNVGAGSKLPFGFESGDGTSRIEYPNHSVKENRNYQVGIILADRFGRESGVILSDAVSSDDSGTFVASSLYLPYTKENQITPYNWPGNSLKVLFNETISPSTPNSTTNWPGLYNNDQNSVNYNPLGWYSYKIVVKQTEQEYYNVYLPGTMAAYPESPTLELGKTSHVVLLNDNINKVPRDLAEVGPGQKQFRSSVILYPRVNNNALAYNNEQYYPGNEYAFVNTIATNNSLFFIDGVAPTTLPTQFNNFYQIDSDPLIARISTPEKLGITASASNTDVINLSIFETSPVESKLDIYWETSSTGTIEDLNYAIQTSSTESIAEMNGWSFDLSEEDGPGTIVTQNPLIFRNLLGEEIDPTNVYLQSVITGTGINVTNKFIIERIPSTTRYRVKTAPNQYFYYGPNANVAQSFTFSIVGTVGSPPISETFIETGALTNIAPTITNKPTDVIIKNSIDTNIYNFSGLNGSNVAGGQSTSDLSWSVTGNSLFTITSTGVLQNLTNGGSGTTSNLVVTLTDAGGATDTCNVTVLINPDDPTPNCREVTIVVSQADYNAAIAAEADPPGIIFNYQNCDGDYVQSDAFGPNTGLINAFCVADGSTVGNGFYIAQGNIYAATTSFGTVTNAPCGTFPITAKVSSSSGNAACSTVARNLFSSTQTITAGTRIYDENGDPLLGQIRIVAPNTNQLWVISSTTGIVVSNTNTTC